MASHPTDTPSGPLHFVDQGPKVTTRTGMLVFSITSGGEEHQFIMTSHAAQLMMETARRAILALTDEQRNVTPFPARPATRRNGKA